MVYVEQSTYANAAVKPKLKRPPTAAPAQVQPFAEMKKKPRSSIKRKEIMKKYSP